MNDEKKIAAIIAANIQRYMDIHHFTRNELAKRIGVSVASVGFWCTGTKIPRMDKIDKMCRLFDCERSDLLLELSVKADTPSPSTLTPHEQEHVWKYRAIDDDGRQLVDNLTDTLCWQKEKTESSASAG